MEYLKSIPATECVDCFKLAKLLISENAPGYYPLTLMIYCYFQLTSHVTRTPTPHTPPTHTHTTHTYTQLQWHSVEGQWDSDLEWRKDLSTLHTRQLYGFQQSPNEDSEVGERLSLLLVTYLHPKIYIVAVW